VVGVGKGLHVFCFVLRRHSYGRLCYSYIGKTGDYDGVVCLITGTQLLVGFGNLRTGELVICELIVRTTDAN